MPTQIRWRPPAPLNPAEQAVARRLTRIGKFYVFLREVRSELFDEAFQAEWASVYQPRGTTPLPAAFLAMVTFLQAYDQVGDADAVVTAQVDRIQGGRARYKGTRKNTLDVSRCAAIANLEQVARPKTAS